MRNIESSEDIYDNLPIDLFTNELDEFDDENMNIDSDNFDSEPESKGEDVLLSSVTNVLHELPGNETSIGLKDKLLPEISQESSNIENLSFGVERLALNSESSKRTEIAANSPSTRNKSPSIESEGGIWISCVRCGKKNEIDCNFCGKCGLQIHKKVTLVEPEAADNLSPEVSRNIKYHYKRPVFCFGVKGFCFASFSSPSKSVRNVSKFQLSSLQEFSSCLSTLQSEIVLANDWPRVWSIKEFELSKAVIRDGIIRDIASMIADKKSFILDESLKQNLSEYFASIAPKDLGSIKMLATQENVSYVRSEIDEIFHLLVISKTKEACELAIKFKYWDHALIIAKTLEQPFYEAVMNRFLDSRFASGHPLRVLYLIMTNNQTLALDEIRGTISNDRMPSFVEEIWTILINFLLRTNRDCSSLSTIFSDIGDCLFKKELYENALTCYSISALSGPRLISQEMIGKIDYLLAKFTNIVDTNITSFSLIHVINVFLDKFELLNSGFILWRSQFLRLSYAQLQHDFGVLHESSLSGFNVLMQFSSSNDKMGFPSLFREELAVIEARNTIKIEKKVSSPQMISPMVAKNVTIVEDRKLFSPRTVNNALSFEPIASSPMSPPGLSRSNEFEIPPVFESHSRPADLTPSTNNDFLANDDAFSSKNGASEMINNDISDSKSGDKDLKSETDKMDNSANVFSKLKSWLPSGKASNSQEPQKQITKAKMGKPNSFRYDEKLKKWVDDNDPSTFEQAPKLPPPPTASSVSKNLNPNNSNDGPINFRAKKGKVKYFDPLNPDGPSSSTLQPSIPNFD